MGFLVWLRSKARDSRVQPIEEAFKDPSTPQPTIFADGEGCGVVFDPADPDLVTQSLLWTEVERVTAFRHALLTGDLLGLRFQAKDGRLLDLHAEMSGWDELCATLPERLPGCPPMSALLGLVNQPSFSGELVVYRR
jgi:hypothetical protein